MNYQASRVAAHQRRQELSERLPCSYRTSFKTPDISVRTHISHFLDPAHLTHVHSMTLMGMKLGNVTRFCDVKPHPSMSFDVSSGKNTAQSTLKILGPFDIEMKVAEQNARTHVIFSAAPRSEGSELKVALYTSNRLAGLLLAPVSGITFFEDLPYLRRTEKTIGEIFKAPDHGHRALFGLYRRDYHHVLDDLIADALMPQPRHIPRNPSHPRPHWAL